jgi:hydrogenase maturation protease
MTVPVLIFAIGNESRGDDGLAPLLLRQLESEGISSEVELIEDYQLQVENITDMQDRRAVLFIDADVSCTAPCELSQISAAFDNSYTSHAMTPNALLHTYCQVYGVDAPPVSVLRIRGYDFELGNPLSAMATANLELGLVKVREWLAGLVG